MVFASICEHLRACQQYVYFCEHEQLSNFSCEQRALWKIQVASSEHFEYFVNFPLAGISLLLIGYVVLRQVIANNLADTFKTEQ